MTIHESKSPDDNTLEMIIYCHKCKAMWQLNPEVIALSLATNADVWEVYQFILTQKCPDCLPKEKKD